MTAAVVASGRRRRLTDYVPVWATALLTVAALWVGIIALATSATFPTSALITSVGGSSVTGNKCVVAWTSPKGVKQTGDIACLGRHVGDTVTLKLSDPEGITFADPRALSILEAIGLLFTLVPGVLGVGGRVLGISRARRLTPAA